eukprot:g27435.t1
MVDRCWVRRPTSAGELTPAPAVAEDCYLELQHRAGAAVLLRVGQPTLAYLCLAGLSLHDRSSPPHGDGGPGATAGAELLLLFVAQRSLETVEVPLWALIQIGRKSMGADKAKAPPELKQKVASTAAMMHLEACSKLEAAFAAEDRNTTQHNSGLNPALVLVGGTTTKETLVMKKQVRLMETSSSLQDPSAFPMDALAAIHKCADPETRSAFQAIVSACKSERRPSTLSSLMRRSKRAASQELLWELRRALCEKRTPDMALAARLLESGATMRPREGSEESSDDEEETIAGLGGGRTLCYERRITGRPGGPRFSTDFDEMPRNGLDLLALNRFADPKQLDFAINKAVEYQADVNQSGYEKPLTLAVRGRNLAAVNALLHLGATVDKQALSALRTISDRPVREEMEDKFLAAVNRGECSPQLKQLKETRLWILVQSGNVKAAKKRLHEPGGVPVDAGVLLALRRCRDANTKEDGSRSEWELRRLLVEKVGERSVTVAESQAATYELVTEMREAFLDERDPQEEPGRTPSPGRWEGLAEETIRMLDLVIATRENTEKLGYFVDDTVVNPGLGIPYYKTVIEGANYEHADWKDQACVRTSQIHWRDDHNVSWLERHLEMTQAFIVIGKNPGLFVLGEPTHDREDLEEKQRALPDPNRVKAYIIPAGSLGP